MADDVGNTEFNALAGLSRIVLAETSVPAVLNRICNLAVETVDACDMASISLLEKGSKVRSVGATHEMVVRLDEVQYATDQGPCIHAAEAVAGGDDNRVYAIEDTRSSELWPAFAAAAAEDGVRSLLAFALGVGEASVGALNLYSFEPHRFNEEDSALAGLFAAHAAVVLANARALEAANRKVEQLHEALDTRDVIGRAKGIIMEREGVDDEQAFAILKRLSQHLNVKLRDVATEIAAPRRRDED